MFFSYLERCMEIFFPSIQYIFITKSHRFVAKSVHKYRKSTRHFRRSTLLAVGDCALAFYIPRAMIGRNIDNHSLEKKKSALLRFIRQQNIFLSRVFTLKMDKFVLKVKPMEKPRSITPQWRAKQYPGKFHADNNLLFCSTVMLLWITTKSQFLTSTFQLFHTSSKWMNPL